LALALRRLGIELAAAQAGRVGRDHVADHLLVARRQLGARREPALGERAQLAVDLDRLGGAAVGQHAVDLTAQRLDLGLLGERLGVARRVALLEQRIARGAEARVDRIGVATRYEADVAPVVLRALDRADRGAPAALTGRRSHQRLDLRAQGLLAREVVDQ